MTGAPPRRRLAALVVLGFAAAASIATSPTPPTVATRPVDYKETFELTAETPIAVRRVAVQFNSEESFGSLQATLVARLEGTFDPDSVRLSVVPDQPGNQHLVSMPIARRLHTGRRSLPTTAAIRSAGAAPSFRAPERIG